MSAHDERASMFLVKADLGRPDMELRKLRAPSNPAAITSLARAAAQGLLGRAIESVAPTAHSATFHDVAIVTFADSLTPSRAVVRLTRRPEWGTDTGLMLESILSPALAKAGVNVPGILAMDMSRTIVSTDVQIQTVAPGESLRELDHDDARIGAWLPALARTLYRLGTVPVRGAGPLDFSATDGLVGLHANWVDYLTLRLAEHADKSLAAGLIDRVERKRIDQAFDRMQPLASTRTMGLVHGDPGNHNVFVAEEELTLIDWEDALAADPLMDLANWATFHPERRWPSFFASIADTGPESSKAEERALFWLYFLRLALAKTVHRLRFGTPDAPGRPPASRRIQRALAALSELGVIDSSSAGGTA